MANPLFTNQIQNLYQSFLTNKMQFLAQRNVNIPQQYANNPEEAVKYLLNSGKMSQEQFNRIDQLANVFGLK
ncbi:MAG: hypothetical protein J6P79_08265 [Pseudobutyrivibrio sp.]|jgi:hypothetical protein|nr:hypothetical protein [Pseudobutyrivibrio sp.]